MVWMRNKENRVPIGTLIWRPVCDIEGLRVKVNEQKLDDNELM